MTSRNLNLAVSREIARLVKQDSSLKRYGKRLLHSFSVVVAAYEDNASQYGALLRDMAESYSYSRSALVRNLKKFARLGWFKLKKDGKDIWVKLTPKGKRIYTKYERLVHKAINNVVRRAKKRRKRR